MGYINERIGSTIILIIAILLLDMGISVAAVEPPQQHILACNELIAEALLAGEYDRAERAAQECIGNTPESPAGPLFLASVMQYRAIDYDDFPPEDVFEELISETVRRAQTLLARNENDLWAQYYLAAADGFWGSYASLTGSVLTGIMKGRAGAKAMARIVEQDTTFWDAYLFVGSYHYWKSDATARITWLPFIDDEKEKGITEVERAINRGYLSGPISNTVYLEILLDHEPTQALTLVKSLVKKYPYCRLFQWQLGEAYKKLGRFTEAKTVFEHIAESFTGDTSDDGSGPLRCWWKLAVLAADTGRIEDCVNYSRKVIESGRAPGVSERQQARIEGARNYLRKYEDAE